MGQLKQKACDLAECALPDESGIRWIPEEGVQDGSVPHDQLQGHFEIYAVKD